MPRLVLILLGKRDALLSRGTGQTGCEPGLWSSPYLIMGGNCLNETCLEEGRSKKQKVAES